MGPPTSEFITLLKDRIDLAHIPFSDRMARIMLFRHGHSFYIRLAERWERQEAQLGNYRQRHPIIAAFRLIGPDGDPVPFELTTYSHQLVLNTRLGPVGCAFADPETLYFALPAQSIGVCFEVQAEQAATDRRGGTFRGVRNTACTFNVPLQRSHVVELSHGLWRAQFVAGHSGFVLEDKGLAVALHASFAGPFDADFVLPQARLAAVHIIAPDRFRILGGDRFLEVAPATAHKGQTVEWLLDHHISGDALLIYCGDDDKDEEAFAVVRRRGGIPIVVGQVRRATLAASRFDSPDALRGWLQALGEVARENHSLENI